MSGAGHLPSSPPSALPSPQLPASWFVDPAHSERERLSIFARHPSYVGHELMVPTPQRYHTLEWSKGAKLLTRDKSGEVSVVSNVCRHRQALMMTGRGEAKRILCPLHRWTYSLKGQLEGTPYFKEPLCLHLAREPLSSWQGMLFSGEGREGIAERLSQSKFAPYFKLDDYELHSVEVADYPFNWKTFIEVYLEDYHVDPFHPGLGHFVDCAQLDWELGEGYSVQSVGVFKKLSRPGTPVYERWHREALAVNGGEAPPFGAIWGALYPSFTFEWYPGCVVLSNIIPTGPASCLNVVEFYYPKGLLERQPEFAEAQQAAYNETALEDEELCVRMQEGRASLAAQGLDERGPYLAGFEDGLEHFNEWVRSELSLSVP